jgi:ribosomal protein L3 glutamine methyltransferase
MRSAERRPRLTLPEAHARVERRLKRARVAFGHGTTNARDEAAWLVLHALALPLDTSIPGFRRTLGPDELARIDALLEERIRSRKPMAYLAREGWLGEHRFYVDERVIVPRSYIAELLNERLAPWLPAAARVRTALDLCTGSGCLAILVALAFRRARVDAADISGDALEVARRNIGAYRLSRRVQALRSDLYGALAGRRYDLIVSNPPYVTTAAMRRLPPEYRQEPALALAGGHDGLELVRPILEQAPAHLAPGGLLAVEVGHNRSRVEKAWPRVPFTWPQTSGGDDCVFIVRREALEAGLAAQSFPATRAGVSPRPRGV